MRYTINWSNDVYNDLDEIRTYLEGFSVQTANRILSKIVDQANDLVNFPFRCQKISDNSNKRRLVVDGYSVFYEIYENEKIVQILFVWHHSRDIGHLT